MLFPPGTALSCKSVETLAAGQQLLHITASINPNTDVQSKVFAAPSPHPLHRLPKVPTTRRIAQLPLAHSHTPVSHCFFCALSRLQVAEIATVYDVPALGRMFYDTGVYNSWTLKKAPEDELSGKIWKTRTFSLRVSVAPRRARSNQSQLFSVGLRVLLDVRARAEGRGGKGG